MTLSANNATSPHFISDAAGSDQWLEVTAPARGASSKRYYRERSALNIRRMRRPMQQLNNSSRSN
ncbi:hypothetical protein IG631_17244 [Alternaria alternata]|nr:hypothetical protein IG631_17244 [Alternaria alternata]